MTEAQLMKAIRPLPLNKKLLIKCDINDVGHTHMTYEIILKKVLVNNCMVKDSDGNTDIREVYLTSFGTCILRSLNYYCYQDNKKWGGSCSYSAFSTPSVLMRSLILSREELSNIVPSYVKADTKLFQLMKKINPGFKHQKL